MCSSALALPQRGLLTTSHPSTRGRTGIAVEHARDLGMANV